MFPIQEVDPIELAFPADVTRLMPKYDDIPEEFKDWNRQSKWTELVIAWFYCGLKNDEWTPKEGVDTKKALRHIQAILGSFQPKHEHKTAACAYLLSQWFEDVKYEKAKPITV